MSNVLDELIPATLYTEDEDGNSESHETFVTAEGGDEAVTFHISPRTDEVITIEMSIEGAWRLIRQLAECAAGSSDD